jgi:hypothetical protein
MNNRAELVLLINGFQAARLSPSQRRSGSRISFVIGLPTLPKSPAPSGPIPMRSID